MHCQKTWGTDKEIYIECRRSNGEGEGSFIGVDVDVDRRFYPVDQTTNDVKRRSIAYVTEVVAEC